MEMIFVTHTKALWIKIWTFYDNDTDALKILTNPQIKLLITYQRWNMDNLHKMTYLNTGCRWCRNNLGLEYYIYCQKSIYMIKILII